MNDEKPKNIDEYKEWLKREHKIELSERSRIYYESVTNKIKKDFEDSVIWIELNKNLKEIDSKYYLRNKYPLLIPEFRPKLFIKSFDSFLLKTFRKNILENNNWPNEPNGGWILPNNWYSKINDIIRTLFVVKYLDGVEFIGNQIQALCVNHCLPCDVSFEAKEEGYYAAHIYTKQAFEIPRVTWDTERIEVSIEIQITTQLQEVIRKLLHKYYEERRIGLGLEKIKWQWDYKSDEFSANYLGHILHYVEGMIMEIRDKQEQRGKI